MDFIDRLNIVTSRIELEDLIQTDYQAAYDFFLIQDHDSIKKHRIRIEQALSSKLTLIGELDFSDKSRRNFTVLLTLASERIGAFSVFDQLYRLCLREDTNISFRLQAISKYTLGIRRFDDYVSVFDEILVNLNDAFNIEEDNIEIVVAAFIQFYAKIVNNFGQFYQQGIFLIKDKKIQNLDANYILQHPLIEKILEIDTDDFRFAFEQIQIHLDDLLKRTIKQPINLENEFLIEISSKFNYNLLLSKTPKTFNDIRNISVAIWKRINNNGIYKSLGRGASILTAESQLYAYLTSFGNSHCAKISCAIDKIPFKDINGKVEIIDWGCGQGLASIVFLEKACKINISKITLIEPSEIALKRASLHLRHINSSIPIKTVCKKLDMLEDIDILNDFAKIKVHLFSNILDIDAFSLPNLISLIENTHRGINYFICASPYVDDVKSDRVDSFKEYFSNKYNEKFNLLGEETNSKYDDIYWNCNNKYNDNFNGRYCDQPHPESGCKEKWTRIIRVFKVEI